MDVLTQMRARRTGWRWRTTVVAKSIVLLTACGGSPQTVEQLFESIDGLDAAARAAAIAGYVETRGGTPLVENASRLVFLVRDRDGQPPRVVGDFNNWAMTPAGYDPSIGTGTRIPGTEWSYLYGSAMTNARVEYVLLHGTDARPDPLNPRIVASTAGPRSEIRMPFWIGQPELDDESAVPAGRVIEDTVAAPGLGGARRVWYYLPPGYEEDPNALYPVAYVLDGAQWVQQMGVPRVLDRLMAREAAPPMIAVFVEPVDRQAEYARSPAWRRFMAEVLVPAVDARFRTFPAPSERLVLGSALGAYAAVDLAVEWPSVFGAVAALAPPPQAASIIDVQPNAQAAARSIRFFVLGGIYDEMVDGARGLRGTLDEYGAPVTYREVPEGHNWDTFRGHLDEAIGATLPGR